jgi:hypothetical protein
VSLDRAGVWPGVAAVLSLCGALLLAAGVVEVVHATPTESTVPNSSSVPDTSSVPQSTQTVEGSGDGSDESLPPEATTPPETTPPESSLPPLPTEPVDMSVLPAEEMVPPESPSWEPAPVEPIELPDPIEPATSDGPVFVPPPDPVAAPGAEAEVVSLSHQPRSIDPAGRVRVALADGEDADEAEVLVEVPGDVKASRLGLAGGAVLLMSRSGAVDVEVEFDLEYLVATSSADVLSRIRAVEYPICFLDDPEQDDCAE